MRLLGDGRHQLGTRSPGRVRRCDDAAPRSGRWPDGRVAVGYDWSLSVPSLSMRMYSSTSCPSEWPNSCGKPAGQGRRCRQRRSGRLRSRRTLGLFTSTTILSYGAPALLIAAVASPTSQKWSADRCTNSQGPQRGRRSGRRSAAARLWKGSSQQLAHHPIDIVVEEAHLVLAVTVANECDVEYIGCGCFASGPTTETGWHTRRERSPTRVARQRQMRDVLGRQTRPARGETLARSRQRQARESSAQRTTRVV